MAIFAYCKYIKYAYLHRGGGRKVQKAKKYAYIIYEWSFLSEKKCDDHFINQ